MDATVFLAGFALSATLIIAIGAQNAFVLRQGLRREHVGPIVAFCAACDAVLIAAGVAGIGQLLARWPSLADVLRIAGTVFLLAYGALALRRAVRPGTLQPGSGRPLALKGALLQAAAFTWLNPHVYLDTVMLVGAIGGRYPPAGQAAFVGGATTASVAWFSALGYGARWLAPWFRQPMAWRVLDAVIGCTMAAIAVSLWT